MPEGKINEIKTKRFLRKRTTIQAADDIESGLPHVAVVGFQDGVSGCSPRTQRTKVRCRASFG